MYAACMTRGDYGYYTSFLSQFSKLPFLRRLHFSGTQSEPGAFD